MQQEYDCFHCGLACNNDISSDIQGETQRFCCYGCQAVTQAIVSGGLGDFYQHRDKLNPPIEANQEDWKTFDLPEIQQEFVEVQSPESHRAHVYLSGISCAACVWLIENHLSRIPGVERVSVNAGSHRATVMYTPASVQLSQVFAALAEIGYVAQPFLAHVAEEERAKTQRSHLMRLGVAGIGMMQSGMVAIALHAGNIQGMDNHWVQVLRWVNMVFTIPILFYSAQPFFKAAWRAIKARHLVMDVSVSLALILAFTASVYATFTLSGEVYFDSVAMFTFFLLLGRYVETRARWRNAQFSSYLAQKMPLTVTVIRDSEHCVVARKSLKIGDIVWVAPGSLFPCDGRVTDGISEADQSLLTGEATPQKIVPGNAVLAGAYNGSCAVSVEVTAVGADTQLAAIERLVANAEEHKPRQVALADRIAARFVGCVLLVATSVFTLWWWVEPAKAFWVALSVLVVTCPCALSLATPTVLTAAVNRLREAGFLVTGPNALEALNSVDTIVLDKTGTLTNGRVEVVEVLPLTDIAQDAVLQFAAALEESSNHPIAAAFKDVQHPYRVADRAVNIGEGVSGVIDGRQYRLGAPNFALKQTTLDFPSVGLWLLLAEEARPLAWIRLQDELRPSAHKAVAELRELGLHVELLSGDRKENVAMAAKQLGIEHWSGNCLPGDKLDRVRQLQSQGRSVFMLGDGINDVPVLSGADVSCAMGAAADLARTKADCVLLQDNLEQIPRALDIALQTKRVIKQNLTWAILYNLLALPLASAGWIAPWAAAIGMSSSSLIVVLNALRVGSRKPKAQR